MAVSLIDYSVILLENRHYIIIYKCKHSLCSKKDKRVVIKKIITEFCKTNRDNVIKNLKFISKYEIEGKTIEGEKKRICYSLSYSGSYAIAAISDNSIGIDIENVETLDKYENEIIDFFKENYLLKKSGFLVSECWVFHESVIKLLKRRLFDSIIINSATDLKIKNELDYKNKLNGCDEISVNHKCNLNITNEKKLSASITFYSFMLGDYCIGLCSVLP